MIKIAVTEKSIPKIKFPQQSKSVEETSIALMIRFEQRLRELEENVHSLQLKVKMLEKNPGK